MRYNKPVYSKETLKAWDEAEKRHSDFMKAHTHETVKVYKVKDLYIFCIQRKYDACMNRQNQYGIQVWEDPTRMDSEKCLANNWFNNPDDANKKFIFWKEQCQM